MKNGFPMKIMFSNNFRQSNILRKNIENQSNKEKYMKNRENRSNKENYMKNRENRSNKENYMKNHENRSNKENYMRNIEILSKKTNYTFFFIYGLTPLPPTLDVLWFCRFRGTGFSHLHSFGI